VIQYIQDPHHPERMEIKRTSKQVNHVQAIESARMHLLAAPHLGTSDLQRQFANVEEDTSEQLNLAPSSKSFAGRQRSRSATYKTTGKPAKGAGGVHFDGNFDHATTQDTHAHSNEGMHARPTSARVYTSGARGAWQSKMEDIWEERFAALGGSGGRQSMHVGDHVGHMRPDSAPVRNLSQNLSSDRWRTGENPADKVHTSMHTCIHTCTQIYAF
jgi:hypothetical protein